MQYITALRGVQFVSAEAKAAVRGLIPHQELNLEADPNNVYDSNAIRVLTNDNLFIGFVARETAAALADDLPDDLTVAEIDCKVHATDGLNVSLIIEFESDGESRT